MSRGGLFGTVAGLIALLALGLLVLPFLALVFHLSWARVFGVLAGNERVVATSLVAAAISLTLVVLLGTPLAYLLARTDFTGKMLVEGLVVLPLVTPPLVMGLLLVFVYGPYALLGGLLGRVGVGFTDVFPGLVLAESYVAFPYYVLAARAAFLEVPARLERASLLLGRTPGHTFRRVSLPLARGGLLAGAAMAWARAIGEFGATVILAYHPYGMPVKIWVDLNDLGLPQALPLATVLLLVAVPLPLAALLGSRRKDA